ncbi:MAG: hypothetical protein ABI718_13970 [Acidobacteriota bacterium]
MKPIDLIRSGRAGTAAALLTAMAIAAFAHFTYFRLSHDHFYPDSFTYMTPARFMLRGMGFVSDEDVAETLRTPGYPLLLAGAFHAGLGARGIVAMQHALSLALVAGLFGLTWVMTRSTFAAILAAILFGTDIVTIHYANKVLTETVFTAALFVVMVLAYRLLRVTDEASFIAPLLGLMTGVLVLIRPLALFYSLVLTTVFIVRVKKQRVRLATVFLVCSLVLPAGWAFRNYDRTGVFVVSSLEGTNLLMFRAAGALAMLDSGSLRQNIARHQSELLERSRVLLRQRYQRDPDDLPHAVCARTYGSVAASVIARHPLAYASLVARGAGLNLFESDWQAIAVVSTAREIILHRLFDAWTVLEVLFAAAGLARLWKRDRDGALLLMATIGYFIIISAGGESEGRFRVPVAPQLLLATATGMEMLAHRVREFVAGSGRLGETDAVRSNA